MQARAVSSVAGVLIAVESIERAPDHWRAVGFETDPPGSWHGCPAVPIRLRHQSLRLLGRPTDTESPHSLAHAIRERLESDGEGLLGWTWACPAAQPGDGEVLGESLTPGATTLVETDPATSVEAREPPAHRNRTRGVDHVVVTCGDVVSVARSYERAFLLHARQREMKGRRFAFLKVGGPVIEITGPLEPDPGLGARAWGLALKSDDLDATVAAVTEGGGEVSQAKPAIQGGRIASLREPLCGVPLAWLGA